jgi:DNA helicase-2/ATP-dependent DNA helicase PcrA
MSGAVDKIKEIIDSNHSTEGNFDNFALQGGAGSGKTESLKEIILYISEKYPDKKIACITHTNVAVEEIKSRVGNKYTISTIHSFLNELTKSYKKNLQEVIYSVFCLPNIVCEGYDEHKKAYNKYTKKLFNIKKEAADKIIGKKDYDKSPTHYNNQLNENINGLNSEIENIIASKDYNNIRYNETRFDSFEDLSYSHDSLLTVSYELAEKFELLPKIISDKYDYIFIDEYQDTHEKIINLFLSLLPQNRNTTIGLFGDSMQGIYDDGIGNITKFIEEGKLLKVDKADNFRCSLEVIKFINIIRDDDIEQELALKDGEVESDRRGKVQVFYKIYGEKPRANGSIDDKSKYLQALNELISTAKLEFNFDNKKLLVLTNKSISQEVNFDNLYTVFNERFMDVKGEIEKELSKVQVKELGDLCRLFAGEKYNELMIHLKKGGFQIKSVDDKKRITDHFKYILSNDLSLEQALSYGLDNKLIKKSERHKNYTLEKENFISQLDKDVKFKELEKNYLEGIKTRAQFKRDKLIELSEEEFSEFEHSFKKKRFLIDLFSNKVRFHEVLNYLSYLGEETEYITMHKTKGSGIKNVMVVLDEYLWNMYNFKSIYDSDMPIQTRIKNQKLFYVACSRAISNLAIVLMLQDINEEKKMKEYFKFCEFLEK